MRERAGWFRIGIEPLLDPLRADARFERLLAAVGLAPDAEGGSGQVRHGEAPP